MAPDIRLRVGSPLVPGSRTSVAKEGVSPLQGLDILEHCLSFLTSWKDFERASRVCRAWRRCLQKSNHRFWQLHLQRLAAPEAPPRAPPFSQWNTGRFDGAWLVPRDQHQSGCCSAAESDCSRELDMQVFSPHLIPWTGYLSRIVHSSGSFPFLTRYKDESPSLHGDYVKSKGLSADLAFLWDLNIFITYNPIRSPLVDHTTNSAQVYPFIGQRRCSGPFTTSEFFAIVGLHPVVVGKSNTEEIIGDKAVYARYDLQLREMGKSLLIRHMDHQAGPSPPAINGRDRTVPYRRFVRCLQQLAAYVAGGRLLCVVGRSKYDAKSVVSPVPIFWVGVSKHGHVVGLMSSADFRRPLSEHLNG